MKDYSNFTSQSPCSISSLSLGSTSDPGTDMPLQLGDGLGCMRDFQDFDLFSAFLSDNSNTNAAMLMASDLGLGLESLAGLQTLGLSTAFASPTSHPVTPTAGPDPDVLGKGCMQDQNLNWNSSLPALYSENSSNSQSVVRIKTDPSIGLESLAGLQALGLNTTFAATQASQPGTPTACASDSESLGEGRNSRSCSANTTSETHKKKRRRLQNREAQRRFRERKDEYLQTLQRKTSSLEKEYQELLEECNRKSEEASQARKEMETLSRENEDLRKRWGLITLLLSLPNRTQCPTTLLGNDPSQLLSSASITEPAPVSKDSTD